MDTLQYCPLIGDPDTLASRSENVANQGGACKIL